MRGAFPCRIGFVDDGEVEEVTPERDVEVLDGVVFEGNGLEVRKSVDCYG